MIPHIEIEISSLRSNLIELSNLVLVQLKKSEEAVNHHDIDLANEVIRYEKRVNGLEVNIEKACENILALYNPVASDLRFVLSTLKINLNLERMGDYARSIVKIVKLKETPFNETLLKKFNINLMFATCHEMLVTTIEAIENDDENESLRAIFAKDDILNHNQDNAIELIVNILAADPQTVEECLNLYVVVRKLERVGDHIKNIAEEIIFYKEAKILRHKAKKPKKQG
ncbi:MAG: phosphate signaling complex protein PhoU [Lentimicrobiaceae bacterium]